MKLEYNEAFDETFWEYNLPLQVYKADDGTTEILNYMPRSQRCDFITKELTTEQFNQMCSNTAKILRELANKFDNLKDKKIDHIYYQKT